MRYALITQTPDSDNINPGSTLIANGIMYLLKEADPDARFIPVCQDHYIQEEWLAVRSKADVLVFAGGPRINSHETSRQYCDWDIWSHIKKAKVCMPVMDLFVGATHYLPLADFHTMADKMLSEKNKEVLSHYHDLSLVIARDALMKELLSRTLGRSIPLMPCASQYAKNIFVIPKARKKATDAAVIRRLPGMEWTIPKIAAALETLETKGKRRMLVAHQQADVDWVKQHYPKLDVLLLEDTHKMLQFYGGVDRLISLRLHGSIAGLSMGCRVTNIAIDSSGVYALNPYDVTSVTLEFLNEWRTDSPFPMADSKWTPDMQHVEEFVQVFKEAL